MVDSIFCSPQMTRSSDSWRPNPQSSPAVNEARSRFELTEQWRPRLWKTASVPDHALENHRAKGYRVHTTQFSVRFNIKICSFMLQKLNSPNRIVNWGRKDRIFDQTIINRGNGDAFFIPDPLSGFCRYHSSRRHEYTQAEALVYHFWQAKGRECFLHMAHS